MKMKGEGKKRKSEQRLIEEEGNKKRKKNAVWQFAFSFLSPIT